MRGKFYVFGRFHVDPIRYRLLKRLKVEKLRPGAVEVLVLLLRRPNKLVSAQKLWDELTSKDEPASKNGEAKSQGENPVPHCITEIREKIGHEAIETVKNSYRFVGTCYMEDISGPASRMVYVEDRAQMEKHNVRKDQQLRFAKKVDLLGWNLNLQWFGNDKMVDILAQRLQNSDIRLRVILPHPDSLFTAALLDDRRTSGSNEQIANTRLSTFAKRYWDTLRQLRNLNLLVPVATKDHGVRLLRHGVVCSGIARFDNLMIVTTYAYPHYGPANPALIIDLEAPTHNKSEDISSPLFSRWLSAYKHLWNKAEPVEERILKMIEASNGPIGGSLLLPEPPSSLTKRRKA